MTTSESTTTNSTIAQTDAVDPINEVDDGEGMLKRRGLMAGVAAAVAGAAFLGSEQRASAADPNDVVRGVVNTTTTATTITNTNTTSTTALVLHADAASYGFGLVATGTGYGVQGTGRDYAGVFGDSSGSAAGVSGQHRSTSTSGIGVTGYASAGQGVAGSSETGVGVVGTLGDDFDPSTTSGAGVVGQASVPDGLGGLFSGTRAALRLVPSDTSGSPTSGEHDAGEFVVDSAGQLYFCHLSGTPGTWIPIGSTNPPAALEMLPTPERFVDTRNGLGGVQGPVAAGTTHNFAMTARTGQSGNATLQIPADAQTIVGNLTVIGAGDAEGGYLTLWPNGALPTVSNLNYGPGVAVANSFVVGLGTGAVNLFNFRACQYIIDVTGFYR
jgi:hypothetical protein